MFYKYYRNEETKIVVLIYINKQQKKKQRFRDKNLRKVK